MTFTAMKELTDLPVGAKVVLSDNDEHPYVKVAEEWMESSSGVRIRVTHFEGAVKAGHVTAYDPEKVRPFTVRTGDVHYSLAVSPAPNYDDRWMCLTFHASDPQQMYRSDLVGLNPMGMGEELVEPERVPWQAFAKALATQLASSTEARKTEVAGFQTEQQRLTARLSAMDREVRAARALRAALVEFTAPADDVF